MKGKQSLNQQKSAEKRPEEQAEGGHHRLHPLDESLYLRLRFRLEN